jgi:hypothetical protein
MKRSPLRRRTPLRSERPPASTSSLRPGPPPVRRTPLKRGVLERTATLAASETQRAKVRGRACLVCGAATRIDPAHLIPRSLGGCDEPECVVALCRSCHRAYDGGALDVLPHLEPGSRSELAHAVLRAGMLGALRRLTGGRGRP